ncbi:SH3 domain-containing kinase-binding protein 1-like [Bacillus rossius redtenbacheri]|uniref:SH3 domain-containing kinase-binding protein 1-like n=1 Tax=Bacillus rossius redtenbacheri TaxID=93214 RepID=UPI002FDC9E28
MVEAVVEFDYVAQEPDELSLRKGDIITNIRTQPGGWWEGSLKGKRGMFPDNFVKVTTEGKPAGQEGPSKKSLSRRCKVLFSYQPVNDDELLLKVNEIIDIVGEVEEGWWRGKIRNTVGVFPSNFVMELPDETADSSQKTRGSSREASESDGDVSASMSSPDSSQLLDHDAEAPSLPPKPVKETCRVLFPYAACNEDELTLKEGDVVVLLSRDVPDQGWWKGELRGKVGLFPDNFVEVVQQDEAPKKPERPPSKSPLATTNRARDSITKPLVPAFPKSDSGESVPKKVVEATPKTEDKEKLSVAVPPLPGKKPSLPMKKPQRAGLPEGLSKRQLDLVDGGCLSRPRGGAAPPVSEFDSVERAAMLSHPTASRARAPRRRPPTFAKEAEVNGRLMNGCADDRLAEDGIHEEEEEEEDEGGKGARAWERNKAPWMDELKLSQARKSTSLSPTAKGAPSPLSPGAPAVAGRSPEPAGDRLASALPPTTRARTEPSSARLGSARSSSATPAVDAEEGGALTPVEAARPMSSVAAARQHGPRPQSMFEGPARGPSPLARPLSALASPPGGRPAVPSPGQTPKPESATSLSSLSEGDALASPVQVAQLKETVSRLELKMEQQRKEFSAALAELTARLDEEAEKRGRIERQLEKLSNLVTQV